jgi:hypothetical protein
MCKMNITDDCDHLASQMDKPNVHPAWLEYWDEDDEPNDNIGEISTREWHNDHWHKTETWNPWNDGHLSGWTPFNRISKGDHSNSNAELATMESVQSWRTAAAKVKQDTIPDLMGLELCLEYNIPLWEGENGWDYQISLVGGGHCLPVLSCQKLLERNRWNGHFYYFQLRAHSPPPSCHDVEVPDLVVSLGFLEIRRAFGKDNSVMATERTDYAVFADASSDNMSLWIAATPRELSYRIKHDGLGKPLPLFNGELASDEGGFHLACILPSIRCLGLGPDAHSPTADGSPPKMPTFQEACELVRRTRTNLDPYLLVPHKKYVREALNKSNQSAPAEPATPKAEARGGLWRLKDIFSAGGRFLKRSLMSIAS